MNKICKLSAIALLASSTSLMAQSKSFEGASLGLSVSGIGVEVNGSGRTSAGNSSTGSLGKVAEIAAIDLSYGYAIGNNGIIQLQLFQQLYLKSQLNGYPLMYCRIH